MKKSPLPFMFTPACVRSVKNQPITYYYPLEISPMSSFVDVVCKSYIEGDLRIYSVSEISFFLLLIAYHFAVRSYLIYFSCYYHRL